MNPLFKYTAFFVLLGFLAACAPKSDDDEAPAAATKTAEEAFATITQEALEEHLNYLADDARMGRMTGTQEYVDAANYVAAHFESLGLEPAGVDGWFQQVPFIANMLDIENSGVTMHLDSGDNRMRANAGGAVLRRRCHDGPGALRSMLEDERR